MFQLDQSFSLIDSGPIYKETVYGRWPVEPYNTVTTFLFLAFVIYWACKIRSNFKEHLLIVYVLPFITIGFVGGLLYHSLRNHIAWLLLDWVPIVITAIITSIYFWRTIIQKISWAIFLSLSPILCVFILLQIVPTNTSLMSLSYIVLAASVLTPLLLYVFIHSKKNLLSLLMSFVFIVSAITLRTLDQHQLMEFLPMGSHFLWHIFGALACHFLMKYVYHEKPALK